MNSEVVDWDVALALADAAADVIESLQNGDLHLAIDLMRDALGEFDTRTGTRRGDTTGTNKALLAPHIPRHSGNDDPEGEHPPSECAHLLDQNDLALSVADLNALLRHAPHTSKVHVAVMADQIAEYAVIGVTWFSPTSPAAPVDNEPSRLIWLSAAPIV